jgi:3-oxoacyl-[acyl-carrier protein] reductase
MPADDRSAARPLALVTGANRGIGRAIAVALAQAGLDPVCTDLAETAESAETARLVVAAGGRPRFAVLDIAAIADHAARLDAIQAEAGPLTCLVNNAGVQTPNRGDMLDVTPEDFDRLIAINLRGTFFLTQAVARRMLAAPDARAPRSIVTISSSSATMAYPLIAPYCLSKTGLAMMTQLFALRLAEAGIGVYEVRPGLIQTQMTANAAGPYDAYIARGGVPQRRWGTPEDVGRAVATLATGGFSYVTGEAIAVGGGLQIATVSG